MAQTNKCTAPTPMINAGATAMRPGANVGHARLMGAVWMLLCCFASSAQDLPETPPIPEVAVVGQHKGPQMWRITSGDHVVWMLGTMVLLPKRMSWDAGEVEKVLGEVQEVIPGTVTLEADPGVMPSVRLYFQWQRVQELKNGQTLKQVLPADLYVRFSTLRDRYGSGPADMERLQPLLAADHLKEEAIEKSGLSNAADVQAMVLKLARKHHVQVRTLQLTIHDARGILQENADLPVAAQSPCLERMVTNLEKDLRVLRARADAWALGDVQTIRSLPAVSTAGSCWMAAARVSRPEAVSQMRQLWVDAVKNALATHTASFAMLDIDSLLGAHGAGGLLAELRAAGYAIEGPEFEAPPH